MNAATPPDWRGPLAATLTVQIGSALLSRLIPTLGPVFTAALSLPVSAVGYFAAVATVGSILFMLAGTPLIRRQGSIRSLQIGVAVGAVGIAALMVPIWLAAALGAGLLGFGYGVTAPASSAILQRFAPPSHRNLMFSIKQAGVPVGGVVAGLTLPALHDAIGWNGTMAAAVLLSAAILFAIQPLRKSVDAGRDRGQVMGLTTLVSPGNLVTPLRAVWRRPDLARIGLAGSGLAATQGCWFAFLVTFLVDAMDYSLALAGLVFAAMQAVSIFGRVFLGFVSDRVGSGLVTLRHAALAGGLASAALALTGPAWPLAWVLALAIFAGIAVSSWNGVQLAEVARRAPRGELVECSAGGTVLVFIGYVLGPMGFSIIVDLGGGYALAFGACAATSFAASVAMARIPPGINDTAPAARA